ncbi:PLP-dependent aminotransferase family protein [Kocuria rhizophila]|uniref:PLP-dependent aminotransferase family protein n=1 Tax=Kocuria rhizophila TaxID=72000 RepID=A0AAX2SEC6_KOCRH|nr:PLP-dependent aminotransferase family protein [Kocuria rhizophila]KUP26909.1 GntR family transcriptional regulator [Kocuria rhizophila]MBK4119812.1 PLP-dependent aminotransferase family protein [Kocuria rhizophila]MDA4827695.1 PLP-dependent aminotransferase family protein [Kocuria rhizophila]TFH99853.1 PLP-dependent aminotransferase family protein [Kocuria rhizophila]TFI11701.1 PLP-dependent aminotransferase family protein [Kocuria rhizophila]
MRHPRDIDLPLAVDRTSGVPLGEQLVRQVRDLVARGVLRPGDPLPSSRALAARLGTSRGTVTAAWDVLTGEGYLVADRGATRITPSLHLDREFAPATTTPPVRATPPLPLPAPPSSQTPPPRATDRTSTPRLTTPPDLTTRSARPGAERHPGSAATPPGVPRPSVSPTDRVLDLRPGTGSVTALDTPAWRGAWRDAAGATARGETPGASLQEHLSAYLRLSRGIVRAPEDVLVTAGVRDGLQLVLRVLGLARRRTLRVAVENPGYPALRRVVEATGHTALPVAVDHHGLDPAALPTGRWGGVSRWDVSVPPDVLVLTPGHQYPLGGTMPVSRRAELLSWAREHGAVVIEDDYDSELRHTGQPLPALGALDTARDTVVTLGSFAKVLGSSVGVGHLVAPDPLLPELIRAREELGSPVSRVAQDAIARFMDTDEFQRHTARMRRSFRRRRSLVSDALADLPGVLVVPMAGGAHAVVEVPDEDAAVARARERGVLVSGLGDYWAGGAGHLARGRGEARTWTAVLSGTDEAGTGGTGAAAREGTAVRSGTDRAGAGRAAPHAGGAGATRGEPGGAASSSGGGLVLGLTARDEDLARGTGVLREVLGGAAAGGAPDAGEPTRGAR